MKTKITTYYKKYKNWILRPREYGMASVLSECLYGASCTEKRHGHIIYWYKNRNRQRGRRVGTVTGAIIKEVKLVW